MFKDSGVGKESTHKSEETQSGNKIVLFDLLRKI